MADIHVGKFINNLDTEDLTSEKLQGVVNNVYAKAISTHKKKQKEVEDRTKEQEDDTVTFVKSNHDRLKAHKNKPEKDIDKDDATAKDKVAKEINESFSDLSRREKVDYVINNYKKITGKNISDVYTKNVGEDDDVPIFDQNHIDATADRMEKFLKKNGMSTREIDDFYYDLDAELVTRYNELSVRKPKRKVNESLEDIKSEWENRENMWRENILEFPSGDYVYVGIDFDKKTIYAGGATNTGINYDELQKLYNAGGISTGKLDRSIPFTESKKLTRGGKRLTEAEDGNMTIETSTSILDMFYPSLYQTIDDYYIPDNEWGTVDDILANTSMEFAERAIKQVFPRATLKFKELRHPREYNYGGENIIFDVTLPRADYESVKEDVILDPGFEGFLKKNSPRSGYIPFGAYTIDKFKSQDAMYSIGQIVKFIADDENMPYDFDEEFREEISNNFETYDYLWEEVMDWLREHDQAYQDFLTHFHADENSVIDLDSIIGWISEHDTLAQDFENRFGISLGESLIKESAEKIQPGNIYSVLVKELPAEDINHHYSDLYVRKTPKSTEIVNRLTTKSLLSTFKDNIDGDIWYELPFCYTPFFGESKELTETPIPRNATKIKVGGKEFTKEKDWVDGNRVHVSPKDIKRFYGDDVEVLETDPNYKSKRTKEVKVLQGNYGYGWDDLVEYDKEDSAELKQDLRSYRENERNAQFRVITRRVPLGEEKLSEGAKPSELWYNKKEALNNIWDLVCEGDDRLEDIKYIFESGLLKPNEFRYDRWGAKHSLIMGALRNGNYKTVELLKSLGEKILKSEVEEYKDLMARKVYSDETTRDALDESKKLKEAGWTDDDMAINFVVTRFPKKNEWGSTITRKWKTMESAQKFADKEFPDDERIVIRQEEVYKKNPDLFSSSSPVLVRKEDKKWYTPKEAFKESKKLTESEDDFDELKQEWQEFLELGHNNVIEFEDGDYLYFDIDFDKHIMFAGSATNTGVLRQYEIYLDPSLNLDENIAELYDEIVWNKERDKTESSGKQKLGTLTNGHELFIDTSYGSGYQLCAEDGFGNYNPWTEMGPNNVLRVIEFDSPEDVVEFAKLHYGDKLVLEDEFITESKKLTKSKKLTESQTQELEKIFKELDADYGIDVDAKLSEYTNGDYDLWVKTMFSEKGWKKFEKWLNKQGIFDKSTHFAISKAENWPLGTGDYWESGTERFTTVEDAKKFADKKFKSAAIVKIEDDRNHFSTASGESVRFKGTWMTQQDFFKLRNSGKA